jgi:2-polyprenyl-3-methyl-5-hydroxy-6-metoxy-1,4-benzoquinol methylase
MRLAPVDVQSVSCPMCKDNDCIEVAQGPDYDHHLCGDQQFTLVLCRACGTYYLNPRPTIAMLPHIYAAERYYSYRFSREGNSWVQWARSSRDRRKVQQLLCHTSLDYPNLKVLDIGAGDGALLKAFQNAGIPSANLYGLDLEPNAVKYIENEGFRGLLGRIEELQMPPGSFDLISMIQVLEHLATPAKVLTSVFHWLKAGGLLLIETPNMEGWDRRFFARQTWGGYHFPRHWTLWGWSSLKRFLAQNGFDILSFSTPAAAVTWTWSVNHLLQQKGFPIPLAALFSMQNPLALGLFWLVDLLPSRLKRASNIRVIARRRESL